MAYYNCGDTMILYLDYTVDGIPLVEFQPDEIEFTVGSNIYTLTGTNNTIELDTDVNKYKVFLDQEATFALMENVCEYQLRVKKDGEVGSEKVQKMPIGKTLSNNVI